MSDAQKNIPTVSSTRELEKLSNIISLLNETFSHPKFFAEHTKLLLNGYNISEVYDTIGKIGKQNV